MAEYPSNLHPKQFAEHLALRKQLAPLIGENRRLHPMPPGMPQQTGSLLDGHTTIEGMNNRLREKIDSTTFSNNDTKWRNDVEKHGFV